MLNYLTVLFFLLFNLISHAQTTEKLTVYFRFDKHDLDQPYQKKIDSALTNYQPHAIHIEAHCDSFGSNNYNDALSLRRAQAISNYIAAKGIENISIEQKGFGKRQPMNNNEDSAARAQNRRADILFHIQPIPSEPEPFPETLAEEIIQDTSEYDLSELTIGSTFRLQNLNFIGGRHTLLPRSHQTLVQLLNTLKANPGLVIEIQGHICCLDGDVDGWDYDSRNNMLSLNRAKAVYDYLIKNGIAPKRLSYRGFGASRKLIPHERNEAEREENRRVEIMIRNK